MSGGLEGSLKSMQSTANSGSSFRQKFLNRRLKKDSTREDTRFESKVNLQESKRNLESQRAPFTTLDFRKTINQDLASLTVRHKRITSATTSKEPRSPISVKGPRRNGPDLENIRTSVGLSDQRLSPLDYETIIRKNSKNSQQVNKIIKELRKK